MSIFLVFIKLDVSVYLEDVLDITTSDAVSVTVMNLVCLSVQMYVFSM